MPVVPQSQLGQQQSQPSTMLAAALQYAELGYYVFPLQTNTKKPFSGSNGKDDATTNPEIIRQWWTENPNANIGLSLRPSGLVVVDPDIYKDDCEWGSFIDGIEVPDTLIQQTGRGGRHYIFSASPEAEFAGNLDGVKGVDVIRNGYIVAAPSRTEDGQYQWVNNKPIAPAPDWVPRRMANQDIRTPDELRGDTRSVAEALGRIPNNDLDWDEWNKIGMACFTATDGSLTGSILFAAWSTKSKKDNPAKTLRRWNHYSSSTPNRIGAGTLYHLARKIDPNWHPNAISPEEVFGGIPAILPTTIPITAATDPIRLLSVTELMQRPPPQWLVDGMLPEKGVGIVAGLSGHMKSFLAIAVGFSIATGLKVGQHEVKQCGVIYMLNEGQGGFGMRCAAWLNLHGLVDIDNFKIIETTPNLMRPDSIEEYFKAIDTASFKPGLIILDTFSKATTEGDDNTTKDMATAIETAYRISRKYDALVILIDHLGKDPKRGVRGAYAKKGNADMVGIVSKTSSYVTLVTDKQKEGEDNLSFTFKITMQLVNGTDVPVLIPCDVFRPITQSDFIRTHIILEGPAERSELHEKFIKSYGEKSRDSFKSVLSRLISKGEFIETDGVISALDQ